MVLSGKSTDIHVIYVFLLDIGLHLISIDDVRDWPVDKLKEVKVADALKHPNWNMGKKITVDSATLFNKVFAVNFQNFTEVMLAVFALK